MEVTLPETRRDEIPQGERPREEAGGDAAGAPDELVRKRIEAVLTWALVLGAAVFVLSQLQPSLLVARTTPAGGDMGAHVWGPSFMRRHLLPDLRLTGWAPDWYAGFPAYTFYFPLPSLVIALLSFVLPYGVAFKLVTVVGMVTLPVAAFAFARLAGLRFPAPPLMALATLPFLFDRGWTIYGGNIASTLAGEFSFSIGLSLALVFLGVVARGLRTGRHRALAGLLLAACGLCHLLTTIFALAGAVVLWVIHGGRRRAWWLVTSVAGGGLLAAFWSFPFLMRLPYANDMGWEKITEFEKSLLPPSMRWAVALAAAGAVCALILRRRGGLVLVGTGLVFAATFVLLPEGRLWNARFLPFWYLSLYLLAALGVAEVIALLVAPVVAWLARLRGPFRPEVGATVAAVAAAVALILLRDDLAAWHFRFPPVLRLVLAVALVGLIVLTLRRRPDVLLVGLPVVAVAAYRTAPVGGSRAVLDLALWYLVFYLVVATVIVALAWLARVEAGPFRPQPGAAVAAVLAAVVLLLVGNGLAGWHLRSPLLLRLVLGAAVVGLVVLTLKRRPDVLLVGLPVVAVAAYRLAPDRSPRSVLALALWLLAFHLLAVTLLIAAAPWLHRLVLRQPETPGVVGAAFALFVVVGLPLGMLPPAWADAFSTGPTRDASYIPGWARWNYSGYERKPAYPEYYGIVTTMDRVGRETGCGRAHWEYEGEQDRFGTPMALMLLPYWTRGCIGSMEGLYFESSSTTPFHFLSAGELSAKPSNPQRDLPYRPLDIDMGVEHLKMLGARYYMAFSDQALAQARENPHLREVASFERWRVFEVQGAELVTPLSFQPAVIRGLPARSRPWLDLSVNWYGDPAAWEVPLAAGGPRGWPRVRWHEQPPPKTLQKGQRPQIGSLVTVDEPPRRPVSPVTVSQVRSGTDRISFEVDRPGSPVLVKSSYFPNWRASGAEGPWRVTPNLMVVVPTARQVTLHYGWTPVDALGLAMTAAGAVLLVVLARRRPLSYTREEPPQLATAPDQPAGATAG